jgi:hypothetical protein
MFVHWPKGIMTKPQVTLMRLSLFFSCVDTIYFLLKHYIAIGNQFCFWNHGDFKFVIFHFNNQLQK